MPPPGSSRKENGPSNDHFTVARWKSSPLNATGTFMVMLGSFIPGSALTPLTCPPSTLIVALSAWQNISGLIKIPGIAVARKRGEIIATGDVRIGDRRYGTGGLDSLDPRPDW